MIADLVQRIEDLQATEENLLRALSRTNSPHVCGDLDRQLKHIRAEIKNALSAKRLAEDIRKHDTWTPMAGSLAR